MPTVLQPENGWGYTGVLLGIWGRGRGCGVGGCQTDCERSGTAQQACGVFALGTLTELGTLGITTSASKSCSLASLDAHDSHLHTVGSGLRTCQYVCAPAISMAVSSCPQRASPASPSA